VYRPGLIVCGLAVACLAAGASGRVGASTPATTLASRSSAGTIGDRWSIQSSVSGDGRLVAFRSFSTNLVARDTNGRWDVFVRDTVSGTTRRISISTAGRQGNGDSDSPVISPDGTCVAFTSTASDLVSGDTNRARDVFVHSLTTGATSRVDVSSAGHQANGGAPAGRAVEVSDGCRMVAFASAASNLVPGDTNGQMDVFLRDRTTGRTRRVSTAAGRQANGRSRLPAIAADGSAVAFASNATNLATRDTNRAEDVFVYRVASGTLRRVSIGAGGAQANGASTRPALSGDGRVVAFQSLASNLVAHDTNAVLDVFARDLATHLTERVDVPTGTRGQARQRSFAVSISADGRDVGFTSAAANLVSGDTNGHYDAFVRDRVSHTTTRVSLTASGQQVASEAELSSLSGDGRFATFRTAAAAVTGDTNGHFDVFERGPLP
jgi:Tol biopolymer transport system component